MNPELPPPVIPPSGSPSSPPKRRRRRWPWVLGIIFGLFALVIATVAITIWYIQRPIRPVVLTPSEQAAVEQKLDHLSAASEDRRNSAVPQGSITMQEPDRPYTPGSRVIRLTERELNGLLNANTDLGETLRLELGRNAINAYIAAPIPEDVPILGGKMFRARGRFRVSLASDGTAPYAILEDVTVFGLSLPKAWLGGIKGENLLGEAVGEGERGAVLRGVKSLRIEPGALVLEVEE